MPSPRWYLRRLAAMSPRELTYRAQQAARVTAERVETALRPEWPDDDALWRGLGGSGTPDWTAYARQTSRATAVWTPSRHRIDDFRLRFPQEVDGLRRRAADAVKGRVTVFDRTVDLGMPAAWHRDPRTGREWPPDTFHGNIDIRGGGAKGIWEAARQQHLVAVAQVAWLDEDAGLTASLESAIVEWCHQDRWRRGVHWCSGLEMAVRLASWTWIAALSGSSFRAETWRDWTRAIVRYGAHLERHLSRFSSANNHLIGEAAGLVLAARFAPAWRDAARWDALGSAILTEEIERQILADGTPAEQAFHYLGFVLDFYFVVLRVAPELIDAGGVRERIGAAAAFVSTVANRHLELPVVGDDDGGAAWVLSVDGTSWPDRLALASVWTSRGDLKSRAGSLTPAAWWMFSDRDLEAWTALRPAPSEPGSAHFETGGYAVLRSAGAPEATVLFDCGPLGYLSIAAHGHADCLSVCLSLDGRWLLVDPGTYVYHEEPAWRAHFRGTSAHNTVAIDGIDQSVQTGHTMWGARARARWHGFWRAAGFQWTEGEHDGYTRLARPCVHRRAIGLSEARYLLIVDWLSASQSRCLWHYQCAPRFRAEAEPSGAIAHDADVRLSWQVLFDSVVRVVEGRDDPPGGWVSPAFGRRQPAPAIEVEAAVEADSPCVTLIGFGASPPTAALERAGESWRLRVEHTDGADTFELRAPGAARTGTSTIHGVRS